MAEKNSDMSGNDPKILNRFKCGSPDGLFPLPDSDLDLDTNTDSCTKQNFSTGLDLDSDSLIKIY